MEDNFWESFQNFIKSYVPIQLMAVYKNQQTKPNFNLDAIFFQNIFLNNN